MGTRGGWRPLQVPPHVGPARRPPGAPAGGVAVLLAALVGARPPAGRGPLPETMADGAPPWGTGLGQLAPKNEGLGFGKLRGGSRPLPTWGREGRCCCEIPDFF